MPPFGRKTHLRVFIDPDPLKRPEVWAAVGTWKEVFGVEPHKVRDDYANFIVDEPPLKLVLIANGGAPGTLNHIGVEVSSTAEVVAAAESAQSKGFATTLQEATSCCYALQDKVWVHDPAGTPWEVYVIKDDDPQDARPATAALPVLETGAGACCVDR